MKVILVGYMGSGKTGVGRCLSGLLGIPFRDLDEEISKAENREISEIFESAGEIYFRKRESESLIDLLKSEGDYVLAVGGGTPCYGKNLEYMKRAEEVRLVYLKTSLEILKNRLFKERASRPLISHLESPDVLEDFIRKHLFERTHYYRQADITVETDSKEIEEVAEEIRRYLI